MNPPSTARALPPSNVPGVRVQKSRSRRPERVRPSVPSNYQVIPAGAPPQPTSVGLGALPASAGFGRFRGVYSEDMFGALPSSIGFGRLRGVGSEDAFAFGACMFCDAKPDSTIGVGLGKLGRLGAASLFADAGGAIAAALAASQSAQKPAAVASVPGGNLFSAVPVIHTVAIAPQVAANFNAAAGAIQGGNVPSPSQAVAIIKSAIPAAPGWRSSLPQPSKQGGRSTSTLKGIGELVPCLHYSSPRQFGRLGRLGLGPAQGSGVSTAVSSASTGAAAAGAGATIATAAGAGSVAGPVGLVVGVAVGVILAICGGLFGRKKVVPKVSAQDVAQAQQWMAQYTQVAGSVVGRNFNQSAIHDLMTAIAILDPGFWGRAGSTSIDVPAVTNFVNDELPKRLNDFFNALSSNAIGATITMTDDCSILGHGGKSCHMDQTYSFGNPGVNAPSYVLGPIFAQYFFTMCTIYQPPQNCMGHLTAPIPQLYTDLLDWFRSSRPAWDTPQPNVVTGTDLSIAAPTQTAPKTYQGPSAMPVLPGPSTGVMLPGSSSVGPALLPAPAPSVPANTPIAMQPISAPLQPGMPVAFNAPPMFPGASDGGGALPIGMPGSGAIAPSVPGVQAAGFGGLGLFLLAGAGLSFLLFRKKARKVPARP